jgi:hypothetical protein
MSIVGMFVYRCVTFVEIAQKNIVAASAQI